MIRVTRGGEMRRFDLKRRVGGVAAFVAAYALVLNVVLSSLLIAGISPAAAENGHILCLNSINSDAAHGDADKSGQGGVIHCPLCIGHHVTGALSPPEFALSERTELSVSVVLAFETRFVARFRSYDHQSRGPPALI